MAEKSEINFFGLETFEKAAESQLKRPADSYVLLLHWRLCSKNYGCIGVGDAKEFSGDETPSELLPEGWNSEETYLLRYLKNKKLFLLRCLLTEEDLILNYIRAEDMKVSTIIIDKADPLEAESKKNLVQRIDKEIIEPFAEVAKTQSLACGPPKFPRVEPQGSSRYIPDPYVPPLGVGRADVDPFAAHFGPPGGGMLFPMPGSQPYSGIRFDPTHPPGIGPRIGRPPRRPLPGEPDPDEFFPQHNYFL